MATEILLVTDIDNLGQAGDVVKVADGYARNYLLPHGKAELVTESARRRIAKIKAEQEKVRKALLDAAGKLAASLKDASVTIRAKVSEGEELYGSVDAAQIAKALALVGFPEVTADMVQLDENIKTLGTYDVELKLHPAVSQTVKVWVVQE